MVSRVTLDDIVGLERYETIREAFRRRIIELKRHRRIGVGEHVTFVFENFDTVLFQIQEMIRAERISDLDRVRGEIEVYNELIPERGELSATMLIELQDAARIREELPKFYGIDEATWIEFDATRIAGVFEGGRAREDKVSAVQYVRFPLGEHVAKFLDASDVKLVIDHPHYRASRSLPAETRESLGEDLRE